MPKISTNLVTVKREARQRRNLGDLSDLKESLQRVGQLHPIVLEDGTNLLLAGERRLEAAKALGWEEIEYTFISVLTDADRQLIELEENIRRVDLTWQERAQALLKYHELLGSDTDTTIKASGYTKDYINKNLRIAQELRKGNERLAGAPTLQSADRLASIQSSRTLAAVVNDVARLLNPEMKKAPEPEQKIICQDFMSWADTYSGPLFNLIHCDFPYGLFHNESEQGKAQLHGAYEDSPETYWALCETLLANQARLMQSQAHIFFWFSMNYYSDTIQLFSEAGFRVQNFPLIWHKSDGKGIVPDLNRGPRRVYETALLMSRGDRKILSVVDNVKSLPTTKAHHTSEKPVPVLEHFFRMLIDKDSEVLDPTAGSGNALIAATRLGASRVLGLEIDPDTVQVANVNYNAEVKK